jgi:hypothetical protein
MTREQVIETIRIAHQLEHLLDEPIPLADILRQLSERVDELTRWIPVEERLPTKEDGEYVIVAFGDIVNRYKVTHFVYANELNGYSHWQRINKPEGV